MARIFVAAILSLFISNSTNAMEFSYTTKIPMLNIIDWIYNKYQETDDTADKSEEETNIYGVLLYLAFYGFEDI